MRSPLFLAAVIALFGASPSPAATLRVATPLLPIYLGNPYGATALPMALPAQAVYDPLTAPGPAGAALPWLADSWTQPDPSTWIFKLKPGVVYSNGERLTAKAVVAGFDYLMTPQGGRDAVNSLDVGAAIAKVEAVDDLSVRIVTKTADPILPTHLSFFRPPAPGAWADLIKSGDNVAATRQPVGTGPFKVESWDTNKIVLTAHAASWRVPKVDGLEIIVIPDPVARMQALLSGAVDIAIGLPPSDRVELEAAGLKLVARHVPVASYVLFVTVADTPLKDAKVRQALNYAVDKQRMLDAFFGGAAAPASQFSHEGAFGFDPALQPYPFDPGKARALLAEAGYAKGFAIDLALDPSAAGQADTMQQIAADLSAVGVRVTLRATPLPRMIESVQTGVWQTNAFAWQFSGFDSLAGYRFRSCAWAHPYHCDREIMPLIAKAEAATTAQDRRAFTQAALKWERDHPPGIMLWRGVGFDGIGPRVQNDRTIEDFIQLHEIGLKAN